MCEIQALLTDQHGIRALEGSDHFLPDGRRGVVREFEDPRLARTPYSPPHRPGTGYVTAMLEQVVAVASGLGPLDAALHVMTRIPYLQAFANGNKRTARLAANIPFHCREFRVESAALLQARSSAG